MENEKEYRKSMELADKHFNALFYDAKECEKSGEYELDAIVSMTLFAITVKSVTECYKNMPQDNVVDLIKTAAEGATYQMKRGKENG